jgi:nucleotide-binding universal stress UspA family protein
MIRTLLVATDGEPGALGALRLTRELAAHHDARVVVVSVCPAIEAYDFQPLGAATGHSILYQDELVASLRARVERQLAELGMDGDPAWTVEVVIGSLAPSIVRIGARVGADAILLGLRAAGAGMRLLARESVLRTVHLAQAPVVAVPASTTALPSRALVAVDASEYSRRAIEHLADFVAPDAEIHLAHVLWSPALAEGTPLATDWMKTYRIGMEHQVAQLAATLGRDAGLRVATHVLDGNDPARTLLELADELGTELIVAGSHGLGFFGRLVLGSVSSKLLRGATCAVQIVPPARAAAEEAGAQARQETIGTPGTAPELSGAGPV